MRVQLRILWSATVRKIVAKRCRHIVGIVIVVVRYRVRRVDHVEQVAQQSYQPRTHACDLVSRTRQARGSRCACASSFYTATYVLRCTVNRNPPWNSRFTGPGPGGGWWGPASNLSVDCGLNVTLV